MSTDKLKSLKTITTVVYALQAASFLFGITFIIAVIINYVKLTDVQDTWLESHFKWQIRTFWFALLWCSLGFVTAIFFIGYIILTVNLIWVIYRIVKGWLYLIEEKMLYANTQS